MATALNEDAMLAALAKWGIEPKFYRADWRTHDRDAQQGFGPIYGFVVHNFGSDISDENSLAYLYRGDNARGMPGPLSQFAIDDDGTVWVIGWGASNHTGSISRALHALVLKDAAPLDADFRPTVRSGDAGSMSRVNDNYIGVEMTYGKAPTAAQRKAVVRLAAAIVDALGPGYTGGSVIGHRECTLDRSDPVGVSMAQLRRDVNALLKAGPTGTTTPPKITPTPTQEVDPMPTPKDLWQFDGIPAPDPSASNPNWQPDSYLRQTYLQVRAARADLAALVAVVGELAKGQPLTAEQITAAAKAGASEALDEKITDADVALNVTPPPSA